MSQPYLDLRAKTKARDRRLRDKVTSLEAAAARSLAEGVAVEPGPWGRLQAFMAKVLVPATAESRRRGAGARLSDNE